MPGDDQPESQELIALHRQRGALKAKLTDFEKFLSTIKQLNIPDEITLATKKQLEIRIHRALPILDLLQEIQYKISLLPSIQEDFEIEQSSQVEEKYFSLVSEASTILEQVSPVQTFQNSPSHETLSGASSRSTSNINNLQYVKLPTINLPKFDGQYVKWLEFHDTFASLIHENESLSEVQEFHYLRASLEGEATDIIKSLSISSSNYSIAWELLCSRYTNKKLLIRNHLKELFNLKDIKTESAAQLREISDTVTKHLRALKTLEQPIDQWDIIIIHLATSKLNKQTARDWEAFKTNEELPTLDELKKYLTLRADMLDNLNNSHGETIIRSHKPKFIKAYASSTYSCNLCKGAHAIYNCDQFLALTIKERLEKVKTLKLCNNCLRHNHTVKDCKSKGQGCRKCHQYHNTLLHIGKPSGATADPQTSFSAQSFAHDQILLATALVHVKDNYGGWQPCRVLLDSGSQSNFITNELFRKLGINKSSVNISVQGINQVVSSINSQCLITIKSSFSNFSTPLKCLIVNKISENLPTVSLDTISLTLPENLQLADPSYFSPSKIDLRIGAQLFWSLLTQGQVRLGKGLPVLQNTHLGWILSGPIQPTPQSVAVCHFATTSDIQQQLQKFWEVEECPNSRSLSSEEQQCEAHFTKTIQKNDSGRFVVSIPMKDSANNLGESKPTALKRLHALEKRLQSNPVLRQSYVNFMREYQALGHMSKVDSPDDSVPHFYIPHHGVIKESSQITRLRVVFDGSCPSSSGVSINDLQIQRHILCSNPFSVELYGFSDASEIAYSACVYAKCTDSQGNSYVNLICAKSKVAPLKRLTIPRLKLCGAHFLSKLMSVVKNSLRLSISHIYFWSDSTIVLNWLKTFPSHLKVFVSHRVADIQANSENSTWLHVPTADNPADQASRGVYPAQLKNSILWWHGPHWLSSAQVHWPNQALHDLTITLPKVKRIETTLMSSIQIPIDFHRFHNFNRLIRATAYCLRFIRNAKTHHNPKLLTGPLSVNELNQSVTVLTKLVQKSEFANEIRCLQSDISLPSKSKIISLSPFLDKDGILRVGGRLQFAPIPFSKKHQILLPRHHFTNLLFSSEHERLLHAGPQVLLSTIRDTYWPVNGRTIAKTTVHTCIKCFRCKPKNSSPQMGNLPEDRVTQAFPFQISEVDYAGPFIIKDRKGRGCKTSKCYVAVFVCFVTRAIHLELVSSLSTEAFLASFKRFIARRGKPSKLYSDNGSNFIGADHELKQLIETLQYNEGSIVDALALEGISWSFIPPNSPHFGGLWEAGVKGFKVHLRRVAGNSLLTFEQLLTLLAQVESVLNCRPLTPLSPDPNDLEPLTPAHFLIDRKLTSIPEENLQHLPEHRLSDFQLVQQHFQNFWTRWSNEYLHTLQQRRKWHNSTVNVKIGQMILLKLDNALSLLWPVGRIVEVTPRKDGVVRVVTVKTAKGVYKRAITKVFPLPIDTTNKFTDKMLH